MWQLLYRALGGHKFFRRGRHVYVADMSGSTPDDTDDGPLRIMDDKPIRPKGEYLVPAWSERRQCEVSFFAAEDEAAWLAKHLNMCIAPPKEH